MLVDLHAVAASFHTAPASLLIAAHIVEKQDTFMIFTLLQFIRFKRRQEQCHLLQKQCGQLRHIVETHNRWPEVSEPMARTLRFGYSVGAIAMDFAGRRHYLYTVKHRLHGAS